MRPRRCVLLAGLLPAVAKAHPLSGDAATHAGVVITVFLLLAAAGLYAVGSARLRQDKTLRSTGSKSGACFAAGMGALAICLLPPLETWSGRLFSLHMVQHELLMLVAAPLLVLGRPLPVFLWAFPRGARARLGGWARRNPVRTVWRGLMHPGTGWIGHALVLWTWHVPPLFRAALDHRVLHDLQHLSFLLTALLFWSGLLLARSAFHRGASVLYLFTTTVHTGVLGALITLARTPLYAPDIRSAALPGALQDQQLGGLIMWVPGSMVYVAAGLVLFLQWVRADGTRARAA